MPEEPKIKRGKILRNRYDTSSHSGNDMEEYVNTITDPGYPFTLAEFEIEEALDYIRLTKQNGDYIPENWRLFQRKYSRNRGFTFGELMQEIRAEREAKNEDQSEGSEQETETSAIQRSHASSPEQALNGKQKTDHRSVTQFSQTDNLLFLSSPDDREEIAADHAAEQIMQDLRPAEEMMKRPEEKAPDKTMGKRTEGGTLDAETTARVKNLQGKGSPLPDRTRAAMEQSFGTDFGNVRVHTGPEAESLSQKMNARAFTYGNNIAFDRNEFNPDTQTGKELLAHELTHTLQQSDLSTGQGFSNKHETVYRESWESASKRAQNLRIKERMAKEQYDRLKTSFREILNNKNIGWNKDIGGPDAIKKAGNAGVFDTKKTDLLIAEWKWIVDHRASRNEKSYRNKTTMLFQSMEGPLTQVRRKREFRGAGTHTFIQLAAPSIIKATYDASDSFLRMS